MLSIKHVMLNRKTTLQYTIIIIIFLLLLKQFSPLNYTFRNNIEISTHIKQSIKNIKLPIFTKAEFEPKDEPFDKLGMISLIVELLILVPVFIII